MLVGLRKQLPECALGLAKKAKTFIKPASFIHQMNCSATYVSLWTSKQQYWKKCVKNTSNCCFKCLQNAQAKTLSFLITCRSYHTYEVDLLHKKLAPCYKLIGQSNHGLLNRWTSNSILTRPAWGVQRLAGSSNSSIRVLHDLTHEGWPHMHSNGESLIDSLKVKTCLHHTLIGEFFHDSLEVQTYLYDTLYITNPFFERAKAKNWFQIAFCVWQGCMMGSVYRNHLTLG